MEAAKPDFSRPRFRFLPAGTELLQITASPEVAAAARVGDALLGDPRIAIEELLDLVAEGPVWQADITLDNGYP